tara:strand:+ start:2261 stop:2545 length:285 start_codon:yes stop_codon:yes gene_type:complete
MASTLSVSIDVKKIDKSKLYKGQYLNLTVGVRDSINDYDQNVSLWYSQTKEERESKLDKKFIGNGKVVWTDNVIKTSQDIKSNLEPEVTSELEF